MKFVLKDEQNTPLFAKVVAKEGKTLCTVQDRKGRQFTAESDGSYNVGQQVKIKNGVIIAKVKRPGIVLAFNV